jgi:hypothetical protein
MKVFLAMWKVAWRRLRKFTEATPLSLLKFEAARPRW